MRISPWGWIGLTTLFMIANDWLFVLITILSDLSHSSHWFFVMDKNYVPLNLSSLEVLAMALIVGPVFEELVFRGPVFLCRDLDRPSVAVFVSGALFGVVHLLNGISYFAALQIAISGCLYGLLVLKTENLFCPMIAHSFHNLHIAIAVWIGKLFGAA